MEAVKGSANQAQDRTRPSHDDGEDDEAHLEEERTWSDAGIKIAACNLSEKVINAKESQLRSCIAANYSRIRDVEQELHDLQTQLKLTTGPKKSALEMLRKKIESQNEKVAGKRIKVHQIKKLLETAEAELKVEEEAKEQLCQELNLIVQQSASAQLSRLEQLTQRLEQLGAGMVGDSGPQRGTAASASSSHAAANTSIPPTEPAFVADNRGGKESSTDCNSPFSAADSWEKGKCVESDVKPAPRRKGTLKGKKMAGKKEQGTQGQREQREMADSGRAEGSAGAQVATVPISREPVVPRPATRMKPVQQHVEPFSGF